MDLAAESPMSHLIRLVLRWRGKHLVIFVLERTNA